MTDTSNAHAGSRTLRRAFGAYATGVAVIAAPSEAGKFTGITVNSFSSLSLDPPLVLWSLARTCTRFDMFANAAAWGVSILGAGDEALARRFTSGDHDEISADEVDVDHHAPTFRSAIAQFACRGHARHEGGDHLIVVGEVLSFRARPGAGLTYYRGRFGEAPDPGALEETPS